MHARKGAHMSKFPDEHKVWTAMREKGISRIDAHFSGGNDEGGVGSYTFYNTEGKAFSDLPLPTDADPNTRRDIYPFTHKEFYGHDEYWPKEGSLAHILEKPVDYEYGSFAGDFSVHGTCTWDLATKKVNLHGEESTYQPFERNF